MGVCVCALSGVSAPSIHARLIDGASQSRQQLQRPISTARLQHHFRLQGTSGQPQQLEMVLSVRAVCAAVQVWNSVDQHSRRSYTSVIHGKYSHEETIATASFADKYVIVRDLAEAQMVSVRLVFEKWAWLICWKARWSEAPAVVMQ
jgi:hypothetical protein